MSKGKRYRNTDPTADRAVGEVDRNKQFAVEQQRLERLRVAAIEANNARLRRLREQQSDSPSPDAVA